MLSQGGDGAFQVYGVPKDDGGNDQIESACAVALVLEAAVAQVSSISRKRCGSSTSKPKSARSESMAASASDSIG
jgi:hypothetical protein